MRQNKKEVKKMKISEADLFEKIEAFLAIIQFVSMDF